MKLDRQALERREEPERVEVCIPGPFPALALELSARGRELAAYTVLENFSASGFHMRLARPVELNEKLIVITQISQAVIMLRGTVVGAEEREDGTHDLAVTVECHQIFSSRKIIG